LNKSANKFVLYIDTANYICEIALFGNGSEEVASKHWESNQNETELLLTDIDQMLKGSGVDKSSIKAVAINPGPGPYTGLRVGVSSANALAFALNVPAITLKNPKDVSELMNKLIPAEFTSPVIPIYNHPPRITEKKS
jgi:tRNA threonylcarbamoyl adenosine modification protein YeaZ